MKRRRFRLQTVLRHYELQRQRAEQELMRASAILHEIDEEIICLQDEVATLAGSMDGALSASGWMAHWQKSEHLGRRLADARVRRGAQAQVVVQCEQKRKRWAIAEESLLSLRHAADVANAEEETKFERVRLQETIVRRWIEETKQPPND